MNIENTKAAKRYIITISVLLLVAIAFFFLMRRTYGQLFEIQLEEIRQLEQNIDSLNQLTNEYELYLMAVGHVTDNENSKAQDLFSQLQNTNNDLLARALGITELLNNPEIKIVEVVRQLEKPVEPLETAPEIEKIDIKQIVVQADVEEKNKDNKQDDRNSTDKSIFFKSTKGVRVEYAGQVKNGKANGYGVGLFESGGVYKGNWKDNKRHGKGVYTWDDGDVYDGEFVDDKRDGFGSYKWKNGERYEGQWKNDMRHGRGTIYKANGDIKVAGLFENDKLQ